MNTRILRALPATAAVVVIAAGAAFAAGVAGGAPPASTVTTSAQAGLDDDGTADQGSGDALPVPGDDDGTADQGPGDAPAAPGAAPAPDAIRPAPPAALPSEDRPLRSELRKDADREESRTEVRHSGTQTYAAADAGSVTVTRDGDTLTLAEVQPSGAWTASVERRSGREVEVTFRSGDRRVDFKAEIEHDRVEIRVRER